ncbi:MAG: septal ring lytic transglycosylase RlpA family protein [Candidatus Adiutrix sp.]|jgi:rare lipoprotein A|nr:septal ring lytic transglycosylase RlpA family protein [Candidatus Adiutrix sp.]
MSQEASYFHDFKSSIDKPAEAKTGNFFKNLKYGRFILTLLMAVSLCGCAFGPKRSGKSYVIKGQRYYILASAEGFKEKGQASWYGEPFHGRKTASGEVYDMNKISAAHKTLPLHTWVEVTNLDNKKVMTMRINDRGPFIKGRVIDLSRAAAQEMGMLRAGLARVSLKAITGEQARRLAAEEKRGDAATRSAAAGKAGARFFGVEVVLGSDPYLAEKLLSELKRDYSSVRLGLKRQGDQMRFLVSIDGLGSQQAADSLRSRLSRNGYSQTSILRR